MTLWSMLTCEGGGEREGERSEGRPRVWLEERIHRESCQLHQCYSAASLIWCAFCINVLCVLCHLRAVVMDAMFLTSEITLWMKKCWGSVMTSLLWVLCNCFDTAAWVIGTAELGVSLEKKSFEQNLKMVANVAFCPVTKHSHHFLNFCW